MFVSLYVGRARLAARWCAAFGKYARRAPAGVAGHSGFKLADLRRAYKTMKKGACTRSRGSDGGAIFVRRDVWQSRGRCHNETDHLVGTVAHRLANRGCSVYVTGCTSDGRREWRAARRRQTGCYCRCVVSARATEARCAYGLSVMDRAVA
ncbi:hypothetical protein PENSPDRAFT_257683 [Peniophora sp. CONT]|nr:hypothetical protein PENSPDRAFT_257683 [Peniophora sp. CONT]